MQAQKKALDRETLALRAQTNAEQIKADQAIAQTNRVQQILAGGGHQTTVQSDAELNAEMQAYLSEILPKEEAAGTHEPLLRAASTITPSTSTHSLPSVSHEPAAQAPNAPAEDAPHTAGKMSGVTHEVAAAILQKTPNFNPGNSMHLLQARSALRSAVESKLGPGAPPERVDHHYDQQVKDLSAAIESQRGRQRAAAEPAKEHPPVGSFRASVAPPQAQKPSAETKFVDQSKITTPFDKMDEAVLDAELAKLLGDEPGLLATPKQEPPAQTRLSRPAAPPLPTPQAPAASGSPRPQQAAVPTAQRPLSPQAQAALEKVKAGQQDLRQGAIASKARTNLIRSIRQQATGTSWNTEQGRAAAYKKHLPQAIAIEVKRANPALEGKADSHPIRVNGQPTTVGAYVKQQSESILANQAARLNPGYI